MISERLKKFIFDKLYKDLGKAEIINYNGNIWFIDRENKYWYFELQKDGKLWWRYSFFDSFFKLFCFDTTKFEPIIKDWVEEVLNHKVTTFAFKKIITGQQVEEVLNHKVDTTTCCEANPDTLVEEVLNHKVNTTQKSKTNKKPRVEEVLNYKVGETKFAEFLEISQVEEVLNHKVDKTASSLDKWVGEILKCTSGTVNDHIHSFKSEVEEVLNHSVTNINDGD